PRRAHVVRVLLAAVPEPADAVAQLPLTARLGRVRDLHVPLDQHRVLHRRPRPGPRRAARRLDRLAPPHLLDAGARLGGFGHAVAPLSPRLRPARVAGSAAGALGPSPPVVGPPDGTR